jgi:hypothetical protein
MNWVDRIVEATGWRGEPDEANWSRTESQLGVALPGDFKELCRTFPPGMFSAYLDLMRPTDEHDSESLFGVVETLRIQAARSEGIARMYEPYGLFEPGRDSGLILWGRDQTEGEYYWLADRSVDPDRWPVLARSEGGEPWDRFEMSTGEVVFRVIADPQFKPYGVANPPRRAFYLPYWQPFPPSPEEWEALTSPERDA